MEECLIYNLHFPCRVSSLFKLVNSHLSDYIEVCLKHSREYRLRMIMGFEFFFKLGLLHVITLLALL